MSLIGRPLDASYDENDAVFDPTRRHLVLLFLISLDPGARSSVRNKQSVKQSREHIHDCPRKPSITKLTERRDRSLLQHFIDVQVDMLIVKAQQVLDLRALGNWRRVAPHNVLDQLVANPS
jgi:hypothetical protein